MPVKHTIAAESRPLPQQVERDRDAWPQICETCSHIPARGESIAEHISRKHLRGRGGYW